jgi:tRNA modification GTPase
MNALVGQERAIVSPVPGTTRDVVESTIVISGVPVRLLDTAGLGEPRDAIDAEAMRRTRKAIDASDFAVMVIDTSAAIDETALSATASKERVVVLAKSDLPSHPAMRRLADAVRVSAVEGTGLDALRQRLQEFVRARAGEDGDEGELVVSLRQRELLSSLSDALRRGARMSGEAPLEIALVDFRDALASASELLGVGVGDVVLDRVFASFCLGK